MDLKVFLESAYKQYHTISFIDTDPVQIPHRLSGKENIEIASLLTCTIAWGQRKTIIRNATKMMDIMDSSPLEFITSPDRSGWNRFQTFVHRTFQPADLFYFLDALRNIYQAGESLEALFYSGYQKDGIFGAIMNFRKEFLRFEPLQRTLKHVSDPSKGSAAKRLNLMLMWLCRKDELGIHFGIWDKISQEDLVIPLDLHVGRVARKIGLLDRKANDWKAAIELTSKLREFDPNDPVKYDFSLFCTGLNQNRHAQ